MEELVENHSRIIRHYQGDRKVGLIVDEWGTWFDVEPGTNPGFLYQQNTLCIALQLAGVLMVLIHLEDVVGGGQQTASRPACPLAAWRRSR